MKYISTNVVTKHTIVLYDLYNVFCGIHYYMLFNIKHLKGLLNNYEQRTVQLNRNMILLIESFVFNTSGNLVHTYKSIYVCDSFHCHARHQANQYMYNVYVIKYLAYSNGSINLVYKLPYINIMHIIKY